MAPSRLLPIATFLAEGFPVRPRTLDSRVLRVLLPVQRLPIAVDGERKAIPSSRRSPSTAEATNNGLFAVPTSDVQSRNGKARDSEIKSQWIEMRSTHGDFAISFLLFPQSSHRRQQRAAHIASRSRRVQSLPQQRFVLQLEAIGRPGPFHSMNEMFDHHPLQYAIAALARGLVIDDVIGFMVSIAKTGVLPQLVLARKTVRRLDQRNVAGCDHRSGSGNAVEQFEGFL